MGGLSKAPHSNLPAQLTSFIGRERDIVEVKRLLARTRLLTLTGAGGCGKTRLAQEVGAGLLSRFSDGVWWVEMAVLSDPELVPQAVATALGLREQPGRSLLESLVGYLRAKSVLLLLDNCEHLLSTCAQLSVTLLGSCATLRILATSRQALNATGEAKWRVPSLSLPPRQPLPSLRRLAKYEAVRLFCERARAAEPAFTLSDRNAPAVVEVCTRLDGIPLALELAAARIPALTAEQIAQRLDDRFRLLTGGRRGGLPRQQTLRATMDWSFGLLTDGERTLLRRLSVFAGGCSLEAAEAICSGESVKASDVLDLLTQLVDKSLVIAEINDRKTRYHLLETVRQYGADRLSESREAAYIRNRHIEWYADLSECTYSALWESGWRHHEATLDRLRAEHDNLRGALAWSLVGNADAGLRLASVLGPFWTIHGHYGEARAWLSKMLERTDGSATSAKARAIRYAAHLAWMQGSYREAVALGEEALRLAKAMDLRVDIAGSFNVLGCAHMSMGHYEQAAALLDAGREAYQQFDDTHHVAEMLRHRGHVATCQGDYQRASLLLEQALNLHRQEGVKYGIAFTLLNLGVLRRYQGDYSQAADVLEKSLTLFRQLGATMTEGKLHALHALAAVLRLQGNHTRALRLYAESLALSRDAGIKLAIQGCFYGMASVTAALGQCERAARLFAAAEVLRESIGYALPRPDREEYTGSTTAIRSALGDLAFAAASAEGAAMTLEEAVEYALSARGDNGRNPRAAGDHGAKNCPSPLAPREREVAALVARGLTNQEIASRLVITQRTAETHVQHILNKLGFNSRAQIAVWAVENGLHEASLKL